MVELVEDLENRFVIDSTNDVVGVAGGGGVVVSTIGIGSLVGGSSSIKETSSSEPVDVGR